MTGRAVNKVLIVGGGITGLTLAVALRQKDIDVMLVELYADRDDDGNLSFREVGHGITVQGNALKAFESIGVAGTIVERGQPFSQFRLRTADGHVIAEQATPPMGGPDLPGTCGALRSDIQNVLITAAHNHEVDVRLGVTVTSFEDTGDQVVAQLSDGTTETVDLLVGADGIRSKMRGMIGIEVEPTPVGMGIWRVVAKRPPEMECSEMYYGGPKFKAGYTPISDEYCYAFLLEENLDRSYIGEHPNGHVLKEHGQGYGGTWGKVRDSLADDEIVNYQWIEAVVVDQPWHKGRVVIVGDAAHACPPLIAQGAAMCAEDAVVLAEELTRTDDIDQALQSFWERRLPRVKMVLDNSLQLAEWEIHPDTPGADPGRLMGQTLVALCQPA